MVPKAKNKKTPPIAESRCFLTLPLPAQGNEKTINLAGLLTLWLRTYSLSPSRPF